ncbi:unnamed protein product [Merluccius merluccius]
MALGGRWTTHQGGSGPLTKLALAGQWSASRGTVEGLCSATAEESFYVAGVTSFGEECGLPHRPGPYAQSSGFSTWLDRTQAEASSVPACRLATAVSITFLGTIWMLV